MKYNKKMVVISFDKYKELKQCAEVKKKADSTVNKDGVDNGGLQEEGVQSVSANSKQVVNDSNVLPIPPADYMRQFYGLDFSRLQKKKKKKKNRVKRSDSTVVTNPVTSGKVWLTIQ